MNCPHCDQPILLPKGPQSAPVLIVFEFPTPTELENGAAFSDPAKGILRAELAVHGFDLLSMRLSYFWRHAPNKVSTRKGVSDFPCYSYSVQETVREAHGRKAVLLLGSLVSHAFLEESCKSLSGIPLTCAMFPDVPYVMTTLSPESCSGDTCGEFKLAMHKFVRQLKKLTQEAKHG